MLIRPSGLTEKRATAGGVSSYRLATGSRRDMGVLAKHVLGRHHAAGHGAATQPCKRAVRPQPAHERRGASSHNIGFS
eukprot:CAMPEP_0171213922 /NCGR_PEP_ID=MMETSP0790-20130122/30895_1 /TAXON_ID=2925 /ORGANISM="Alexandrium catenella, Strain OF101" /LENGTH=77 /DNA_ID=CAMNT_0011679647 /DNA_START=199 /DNA_END=429 /DNA_ORIENTATION=+